MTNIRSFLGAAGVAAVAALGMSTAALAADEGDKFGYSITITATSDYIFRGISLTNSDPAFQPFVEFTYGNPNLTWYLDFWGSNVKDNLGDPVELDIYAGVRPVTGPVSWDLGVLYYMNPYEKQKFENQFNGHQTGTDYVEFKIAASITPITNLTLTGIGFMTPDQGFNTTQTETGEFDVSYTLPQFHIFTPTLSGAVGYTNSENHTGLSSSLGCLNFDVLASPGNSPANANTGVCNYAYWNAGLKLTVDKYFMDFRYWDTSISKHDDPAGDASARFVFSAGVNLP